MDWNEYLDALAASELAWRDESYVAGMKALRLCTDVATYRALLKGQAVPGSRMDQVWARRYGLL
jgi:hypothetical protein